MTSEHIPMTTINSMQDLTRLLREHPEWRDELRRELLTDELLELPQRFAEYTASTDGHLGEIDRRLHALTETAGKLVQHAEATDRRLDDIDRRLDALAETVGNWCSTPRPQTGEWIALSEISTA